MQLLLVSSGISAKCNRCRILTQNEKSMGGAVCFSIYEKCPSLWRGVVFQAPMCKIKEEMVSKGTVIGFRCDD